MGMSRDSVPRIGRTLDVVGLAVLLIGGAFVLRARTGYGEVQAYVPRPDDPPMAAMQLADGFYLLEKVGAGLILVGIGVFVTAWWVARTVYDSSPPLGEQ